MRTFLTGLASAAIMATGIVATAPPASAETRGCVTQVEYRKISKFDSIARTHRIFDTRGELAAQGYGRQSRTYNVCGSDYGQVTVTYMRFDGALYVETKSAYWG
jgi:hypothetical protein